MTRRFFSGSSLDQAVMMAARHYGVDPEQLAYRQIEKKHGFLRTRKAVMIADQHEMAMKIAIANGVKIAMGTDIFVSGPMYGMNSMEVKFLIDAGLQPLEAIEAATANGPDTLGPQAPLSGQLREGYDADVIAFDADPLDDTGVWGDADRVTHVWKAGELVKQP